MSSTSVCFNQNFDVEIIKEELYPDYEENYENNTPSTQTSQTDIKIEVTDIKIEEFDEVNQEKSVNESKIGKKADLIEVRQATNPQSKEHDSLDDISVGSVSEEDSSHLVSANQCHLCPKSLPSYEYKKHMLSHSRLKKIRCVNCDSLYLNKKTFSSHMLSHHANKITLQCKLCSRKFSDISLLEFHMIIHSSETFSCDFCKENFEFKSLLTVHMKKHTGGKTYLCDKCNKELESPTALKRHKAIHTGEKDFVCNVCKAEFNRKAHFNRHIRQHQRKGEM